MEYFQILWDWLSEAMRHAYEIAECIGLVAFLWILKKFLFFRLRRLAAKTRMIWDDILLESLSGPANLVILSCGPVLLVHLLPVSERISHVTTMVWQVAWIIAITIFLEKFACALLDTQTQGHLFQRLPQNVVKRVLRIAVLSLAALMILNQMGISITPLLASLGIGSLAVALALQDTLSNFFAGIYMAMDRPVRKGDFIHLETGQEGYVADVGWRSTRIRTLPNQIVIVPNSKLMGSVITNYDLPDKEVAVLVEVSVHYDSDLARVEKVVEDVGADVLRSTPGGMAEFKPFIRYHTFGDSGIGFTVILRVKQFVDNYLIKHEFIKKLHERFRREGFIIPYPIRTLDIPAAVLGNAAAIWKERS